MHNLDCYKLIPETCNKNAITDIAINLYYITRMTRGTVMYHVTTLPKLKRIYVVEGPQVPHEWLGIDRSVNWDIKFVDLPVGEHEQRRCPPYNTGYADVVRVEWKQVMAPEITAGTAPELIFKFVERENLDESLENREGIRILDNNPAPQRVVIDGREAVRH